MIGLRTTHRRAKMTRITSPLYELNIDRLTKGCNEKWFGSTRIDSGSNPRSIEIDESEPLHFVQLLYILKEICWQDDRWIAFSKANMERWVQDEEQVYLENTTYFGREFFKEFPTQINNFLKFYCDNVGCY